MRARIPFLLGVIASVLVAGPGPGSAQIIDRPTFLVSEAAFADWVQHVDVAAAPDNTAVFFWSEYTPNAGAGAERAVSRWFWFIPQEVPLAPPVRVDTSAHVREVAIAPDTRGGYVSAWFWVIGSVDYSTFGRLLDTKGVGVGPEFIADLGPGAAGPFVSVAGLPSGFVYVWSQSKLWARLYDPQGQRRGNPIDVGAWGGYFNDVGALPDGGFVVAWNDFSDHASYARIFDSNGQPRGPAFLLVPDFTVRRIAVSAGGSFAVAGGRENAATHSHELWLRRFAHDGTPLGDAFLAYASEPGEVLFPDLEADPQGNLYLVWGTTSQDHVAGPIEARAFDSSDNPLGPEFVVDDDAAGNVRTALLADGRFLNTWASRGKVWGSVVKLCTPDISQCGDGVVVSQCEQCDEGAANSDATPDACRTDCRRARCGDSVIDSSEACDDGNTDSCDGCSAACQVETGFVCGDGVLSSACGERCDDGNQVEGDGCSSSCRLERVPGGGSAKTDCYAEWQVNNPANQPLRDRRGQISADQRCTDNDPRCDFDGGVPGRCTLRIGVCMNNGDVSGCTPGAAVASFEIKSPSAKQAEKVPEYARMRDGFADAVAPLLGMTTADVCSALVDIEIPLRAARGAYRPSKLRLASYARLADGKSDGDALAVTCVPGAP